MASSNGQRARRIRIKDARQLNPVRDSVLGGMESAENARADDARGQSPVADIITKPFSLQQICNAVDAALAGQRPAS